jgi:molybdopterin-guanine dinucleotide biosynthesis protein A
MGDSVLQMSMQVIDRAGVTGAVLCGGVSRRMGADKGKLMLGEETLIARAVRALSPVSSEVVLSCGREPKYSELGLRLVLDSEPDVGPLAGIAASLDACDSDWLAVLACDLPHVVAAVPRALLARASSEGLDVCTLSSAGQVEPLIAVYRRTCLAPIREAMSLGLRRVDSFHTCVGSDGRSLSVGTLDVSELSAAVRSLDVTMNLNTPEQFAAALSLTTKET